MKSSVMDGMVGPRMASIRWEGKYIWKGRKRKKNTHKNKSPVRCFGFLIYENDVYFDSSASIRFIQLERNDQLYEKGL